jgi:hypothetical protein
MFVMVEMLSLFSIQFSNPNIIQFYKPPLFEFVTDVKSEEVSVIDDKLYMVEDVNTDTFPISPGTVALVVGNKGKLVVVVEVVVVLEVEVVVNLIVNGCVVVEFEDFAVVCVIVVVVVVRLAVVIIVIGLAVVVVVTACFAVVTVVVVDDCFDAKYIHQ